MAWLIQHKTGKWFLCRGNNRCEAPYGLTPLELGAAHFATREEAERVKGELVDFSGAYHLIEMEDEDDRDAAPYGPSVVV